MADLLQLSGLVAGGAAPESIRPPLATGAAGQAGEVAARPTGTDAAERPAPADRVDVRPPVTTDVRAGEAEVRQRAVTAAQTRADALEQLGGLLQDFRTGRTGAVEDLRAAVEANAGKADVGPNLAELLMRVDPISASAVDPGLVETAMVETENALAATYGVLEFERRGLAAQQVAVENESAARVELETVQRAAELLREQEQAGQPVGLLEALRGPAINRNRVVELLLQ